MDDCETDLATVQRYLKDYKKILHELRQSSKPRIYLSPQTLIDEPERLTQVRKDIENYQNLVEEYEEVYEEVQRRYLQSVLTPIEPESRYSKFTVFVNLPPELRLKIWAYVMANLVGDHEARIFNVSHGVVEWTIISTEEVLTLPMDEKTLSSLPILVCKEFLEFRDLFRDACVCLKNKTTGRALKLRFNTRDVVYFKNFRYFAYQHFTQDIDVEDSALSRCSIGIETLCFSEGELYPFLSGMGNNSLPAVLSQFKRLKNVWILLLVPGKHDEALHGEPASSCLQIPEGKLHGKNLMPWSTRIFSISWVHDTLSAFSKDHPDWEMPTVRFVTTEKPITTEHKRLRQSIVNNAWERGR